MSLITVTGNLTADPELRFTPDAIAVANFTVAENHRRRNSDGEWDDVGTTFHNVTVWREYAENVAESLRKGSHVIVYGEQQDDPWQDDQGNTRHYYRITAYEIGQTLRFGVSTFAKNSKRDDAPPAKEPSKRASNSRTKSATGRR